MRTLDRTLGALSDPTRSARDTDARRLEPPLPSGDSAGEEDLVQTAKMIRNGRRGDAVASFLAGVGLPPEVIDGMKESPE
jgi:hypothetical protein